mmetsp:Transcript_17162/g.47231  ORF Transcript_17162/g.47231 Transcript_17162/m.47231 type:complete len:87 (-) Transcript_17162:995-1255(-)
MVSGLHMATLLLIGLLVMLVQLRIETEIETETIQTRAFVPMQGTRKKEDLLEVQVQVGDNTDMREEGRQLRFFFPAETSRFIIATR